MFCDYDDANYFFHFHFGEWVGKKGCFLFFSSVVMKKFSSGYIRLSDLLLAPYSYYCKQIFLNKVYF